MFREVSKDLLSETGDGLIDRFLKENYNCKILIYWCRKIFNPLEKLYLTTDGRKPLLSYAIDLFYNEVKYNIYSN